MQGYSWALSQTVCIFVGELVNIRKQKEKTTVGEDEDSWIQR